MNARDLFKRNEVLLEYRPVRGSDGNWTWHWVLLSLPAEDKAVASGTATSRGEASTQARRELRKLGYVITKTRLHHHALKS